MSSDTINNSITDREMAILGATRDIVCATVSKPGVFDVIALIGDVHAKVTAVVDGVAAAPAPVCEHVTAAEARRSITPAGLVSFIDGKTYQTLKRHLSTHGTDMAAYRQRFGLPADYPSTAPAYSVKRSALAKATGLGQPRAASAAPEPMQAAA